MAKSRLTGGGYQWPAFPPTMQRQTAAPSLAQATLTLDAAGERLAMLGHVQWADGQTHSAETIRFRTGTSTSPVLTLRASLRDPTTSAGPPGRDDGTVDQSATQTNPAATTVYSLTLDAVRSIAHGELVAVCFDVDTYTSGAIRFTHTSVVTAGYPSRPLVSHFDGASTWTIQNALPCVTLIADDGTYGILAGSTPPIIAINTHTFNSGSTPDEHAMEFTVDAPAWCGGAGLGVLVAAGGDFDVVLYEGTTALVTASVISDTLAADSTYRPVEVAWPDVALTPGNTYRLAIKPTSANNVSVYSLDVTDADELAAFVGTMQYTTRTDAGAFAAPTATRTLVAWLTITAIDDGAGSGGGGLLTHPGMAGGING